MRRAVSRRSSGHLETWGFLNIREHLAQSVAVVMPQCVKWSLARFRIEIVKSMQQDGSVSLVWTPLDLSLAGLPARFGLKILTRRGNLMFYHAKILPRMDRDRYRFRLSLVFSQNTTTVGTDL